MNSLVILRGWPGSGKSTLAKLFAECAGFVHVEADMFFSGPDGYKFDATKLGQAHDWCHKTTAIALERGDNVVVSNTFTRRWEVIPYHDMAQKLGAKFFVYHCNGHWPNTHGVPQETVDKMEKRMERWYGA